MSHKKINFILVPIEESNVFLKKGGKNHLCQKELDSPRRSSPLSGRRISPRGEGVLSGDSGSEIAPRSDPSPAAGSPA